MKSQVSPLEVFSFILISMLLFSFIVNSKSQIEVEAQYIRYSNIEVQRILGSVLSYGEPNNLEKIISFISFSKYENIGGELSRILNLSTDKNYIFYVYSKNKELKVYNNASEVCLDYLNKAYMNISLPDGNYSQILLGLWDKSKVIETC